jgi:hypothetical protein
MLGSSCGTTGRRDIYETAIGNTPKKVDMQTEEMGE